MGHLRTQCVTNLHALARCVSCESCSVNLLLDFGAQPPSNRFFRAGEQQDVEHPLELGQCRNCGLVQLIRPMPHDMVRPMYEWITYNEPEGHLDEMVEDLVSTTGIGRDALIMGLTYKDKSTLARFNKMGYAGTYVFKEDQDWELEQEFSGLETIQSCVTADRVDALVGKYGQADLLIVRHVLEHAHEPVGFLSALARLVKPNGHMVFEMPDSTKFLKAYDYSFIWEEHVTYFTPTTLSRLLGHAGLEPQFLKSYAYPLEDSLVTLVRPFSSGVTPDPVKISELEIGMKYGQQFVENYECMRGELLRLKLEGKRVALFGAGHLAVKFLNFFNLRELVYCVIDDNPQKLDLCMPGSGLPVRPSSVLFDEDVHLCLLSLSPESEKKLLAAKQPYLEQGGQFRSIFALSPIAYWTGLT